MPWRLMEFEPCCGGRTKAGLPQSRAPSSCKGRHGQMGQGRERRAQWLAGSTDPSTVDAEPWRGKRGMLGLSVTGYGVILLILCEVVRCPVLGCHGRGARRRLQSGRRWWATASLGDPMTFGCCCCCWWLQLHIAPPVMTILGEERSIATVEDARCHQQK
ncbi:hypothetical protein VTO42DRAFT_514 [Malbranchea cinnamomea]